LLSEQELSTEKWSGEDVTLAFRIRLEVPSEIQGTRSQTEQPEDQLGEGGEEHEHFEARDRAAARVGSAKPQR